MRTVTVINTQGRQRQTVQTSANTWGELKRDLDSAGIPHSGMRAMVGENHNTLETSGAQLPSGLTVGDRVTNDFTLFLSAKKVKSGI